MLSRLLQYGRRSCHISKQLSSVRFCNKFISYSAIQLRQFSISSASFGVNVRPVVITTRLAAEQLVRDLDDDERARLTKALSNLQQEFDVEKEKIAKPPTIKQLYLIGFCNSVPFVGFGFLDNAIMITAGEYIDISIGVTFGISTMAAAALGNMISDIAGIGLAGYVEAVAGRLGIKEPKLEAVQLTMKQTKFATYMGRGVGIVIGCIIGMFPLLLVSSEKCNKEHMEEADKVKELGKNEEK